MKTKLFLMCVMAASAAYSGAAMPTEAEVEKAVPKVERMLASEKVALASGKMTRAEVAAAAMKLAEGVNDEAAKLLHPSARTLLERFGFERVNLEVRRYDKAYESLVYR